MAESDNELDLGELFESAGSSFCPWDPHGCDKVNTFRCTPECEFHPRSFNMDEKVIKEFEKTPWGVYCLTCGQFIESRGGHPENHILATGVAEYREKLPSFVMERLKANEDEGTDLNL